MTPLWSLMVMKFSNSLVLCTKNIQHIPSWAQYQIAEESLVFHDWFSAKHYLSNILPLSFFPMWICHCANISSVFQPFYLMFSLDSLRSMNSRSYTPQDLEWVRGNSEFVTPLVLQGTVPFLLFSFPPLSCMV